MKLENQVCTLKQATALANLGITQKSLFYFAINSYDSKVTEITMTPDSRDIVYSAFTAAELIRMNDNNGGIEVSELKNISKFYIQTGGFGIDNKPEFTYYNSFAEASAEKLINALQQDFIDADTCNKRLLED